MSKRREKSDLPTKICQACGSRLLVTRQQQLDFQDGFRWNEIVHRQPGKVDWPNPNLDVAYSEAWLAVDNTSCTVITVPQISDRYFTVQMINGWGETLANINERVFPGKASGDFAICLRGANVNLPESITSRIDLPVKQARVLIRTALDDSWDKAVAYQHEFKFKVTGSPKLPDIPRTPIFELENFTRTAVAKSNILVNSPTETKYFYQDLDGAGQCLNGARSYTVNFTKNEVPPVDGFWSLTMYDAQHFFVPNTLSRFSLGTKNKSLSFNEDGSLTIYIQEKSPGPENDSNWLPAPPRKVFAVSSRLLAENEDCRWHVEPACRGVR